MHQSIQKGKKIKYQENTHKYEENSSLQNQLKTQITSTHEESSFIATKKQI